MAQAVQHTAASAVTDDNWTELTLRQRFKTLQQVSLDGNKPLYKIGVDGGWRKLAISMAVAYDRMPEYDPNWAPGCLERTFRPLHAKLGRPNYPCHVLFSSLTDLIPNEQWDSDPITHMYESPVATALVGDFDEKLDNLFHWVAERFNRPSTVTTSLYSSRTGGIYASDEPEPGDLYDYSSMDFADRVTADLVDTKFFATLNGAKQYTTDIAKPHHLTRQLLKLLLTRKMRRLFWVIPAGLVPENPADHLEFSIGRSADETPEERKARVARERSEGWNKNHREPIVYYVTHLLQGMLSSIDMQLFGGPRTCHLAMAKYGLKNPDKASELNPIVEQIARKRHPRVKLQNTLLKKMSVITVVTALLALGQYELVRWMLVRLPQLGQQEIDDLCDSIGLLLEFFKSETRSQSYSQAEKSTVGQWNKVFIDSIRFTGDYVVPDELSVLLNTAEEAEAAEALKGAARRMADILHRELLADINEIEAMNGGKIDAVSASKRIEQKSKDHSGLRDAADNDDWMFVAKPKQRILPPPSSLKSKEIEEMERAFEMDMNQEEEKEADKVEFDLRAPPAKRQKKEEAAASVAKPPPSSSSKKKEEKKKDKEETGEPDEERWFTSPVRKVEKATPPPPPRSHSPPPPAKREIEVIDSDSDSEGEVKPKKKARDKKRKRRAHSDSDEEPETAPASKKPGTIDLLQFLPRPTTDQKRAKAAAKKKEEEAKMEKKQKKKEGAASSAKGTKSTKKAASSSSSTSSAKTSQYPDNWDEWDAEWNDTGSTYGESSSGGGGGNRRRDDRSRETGGGQTKSATRNLSTLADEMAFF